MGNQLYLAMTAAEFSACEEKPEHTAWMACHFSPYGRGLSNMPQELPQGSLLILNDRIPPSGHDPAMIARQLKQLTQALTTDGVLLDFQRPGDTLTRAIAEAVVDALPDAVAVTPDYADNLPCAVLLPPPPLRCDVSTYFEPYAGRQLWLDVYDQWERVTVTEDAVTFSGEKPLQIPQLPFQNEDYCFKYNIDILEDRAVFTLHRSLEELCSLPCPIAKFVGLWQDYHS